MNEDGTPSTDRIIADALEAYRDLRPTSGPFRIINGEAWDQIGRAIDRLSALATIQPHMMLEAMMTVNRQQLDSIRYWKGAADAMRREAVRLRNILDERYPDWETRESHPLLGPDDRRLPTEGDGE